MSIPHRDTWVRLTYLSIDSQGEVVGVDVEDVWHCARPCELGEGWVTFQDDFGMFYVPEEHILELIPLPALP